MGRKWTVNTVVEAWGEGKAARTGLGWVVGVAVEDLVLADSVGRRLLGKCLMLTLLGSVTAVGCKEAEDTLAFTWRGASTSKARDTCKGDLMRCTCSECVSEYDTMMCGAIQSPFVSAPCVCFSSRTRQLPFRVSGEQRCGWPAQQSKITCVETYR